MEYKGKQLWQDSPAAGDAFRQRYVQGIDDYIRRKNLESKDIRRAWMPPEALAKNQESHRAAFRKMLGLELFEKASGKEETCLYVAEDEVFGYETALPEAERVHDYFEAFGVPAHFCFHVWEGGHTLSGSDEGFDFLFSSLREEKPL